MVSFIQKPMYWVSVKLLTVVKTGWNITVRSKNCDALNHVQWRTFEKRDWNQAHTLTCVLGKADVRRVSWVSSFGFLRGTLNTNAAWSQVAAVAVMRYPLSHRLCIPSLGYKKSSSTTYSNNTKSERQFKKLPAVFVTCTLVWWRGKEAC